MSGSLRRPEPRFAQAVFERWIIKHPTNDDLAWTGSTWEVHQNGVSRGIAHIANFSSRQEAEEYAQNNRVHIENATY